MYKVLTAIDCTNVHTYSKRFYVIESGNQHQTFGRVHNAMVCNGGYRPDQRATIPIYGILLLVNGFTWHNRYRLIEAHAGAIMSICIDVCQYRNEEAWLLPLRR